MNNENPVQKRLDDIYAAKEKWRKKQSELPIMEKVKILVQMQKNYNSANPEKSIRVWEID